MVIEEAFSFINIVALHMLLLRLLQKYNKKKHKNKINVNLCQIILRRRKNVSVCDQFFFFTEIDFFYEFGKMFID